jgi:hypothetical protein
MYGLSISSFELSLSIHSTYIRDEDLNRLNTKSAFVEIIASVLVMIFKQDIPFGFQIYLTVSNLENKAHE